MRKGILFGLLLSLAIVGIAAAGSYNFVKADDFRTWLQEGKKMSIVDIQPAADFQKQHFQGAIETNAYPVKTAESRQLLDKTVPQLSAATEAIVVICPRGGGGAKAAYDFFISKGIDEKRLFILEGGMLGWPYKSLVQSDK